MLFESPPSHYENTTHVEQNKRAILKQSVNYMMNQLDGWCTYEKAAILIDFILQLKPRVIVEIGVFGGKSLLPMALAQKTLGFGKTYGIDPWDAKASVEGLIADAHKQWWQTVDHSLILKKLVNMTHLYQLENQIELIRSTSMQAPSIFDIDFLHIDGNHSENSSLFDVEKWVPLVKSGGIIIFDDLDWCENGINTTQKAVDYLNEHCIKMGEFQAHSLWGIWFKP